MTQNKQIAIMLIILIFGSVYFNFQIQQNKTDIEKIVNKKTDFRYKSIDNVLSLDHEKFSGGVIKCFDITDEEIKAYYAGYSMNITPFGKLLLSGKFRCRQ